MNKEKCLSVETKLIDYIIPFIKNGNIYYATDEEIAKALNCSKVTIRRYKQLIYLNKSFCGISIKTVWHDGKKTTAYYKS